MATSNYLTRQYTAEHFVESSGAILFDLSHKPRQVCLINYKPHEKDDEWLLAKGRRNVGESRLDAALREVREETGYNCSIHPVTMRTRAPQSTEAANIPDQTRLYTNICEPFMLSIRDLKNDGAGSEGVKIIWWYIATTTTAAGPAGAGDQHARGRTKLPEGRGRGDESKSKSEKDFRAEFFTYSEALAKLTFQDDRCVLARAIELVEMQQEQQEQLGGTRD
ncbi:hypothetical protein L228DRAFT_48929 [Xylona heveae TC161]|uniref:Nudix hydrolase domain-containing protein n=1 Tax=Xylona heveae (strain CBS 132557 / TC161) TaxID=1328760 RepID=A0A164ZKV4_XYLHT|nr:hypothetical protein L228DRAFT_48929 [Xylona heveae TC161]KZF19221.1 hypothetical protein L228DRAFT_48929 [Xylona heveae TC161]